jgi:hypothetical protein
MKYMFVSKKNLYETPQHFSHGELNHAHHTDTKLVLLRACLGLYPFTAEVRQPASIAQARGLTQHASCENKTPCNDVEIHHSTT